MTGMGSQDKPHGGSTQGTKCKSLCNDIERRRSSQSVVEWTTKSWIDSRIKIICNPVFLYSEEEWFTMASCQTQFTLGLKVYEVDLEMCRLME